MNLYQHFRKEEHGFIDQVIEWKEAVENQYSPRLTDFLDPREQEIVKLVIGTNGETLVAFEGGKSDAERKRAMIYPSYYIPESSDYQLAFFEIKYPAKFLTIDHRKMLGTLMSLGLRRSKFGDILTNDSTTQIVVAQEIADYLKLHLQSVGKSSVSLQEITREQLLTTYSEWTETTTTVSSLRLDVVLAAILNVSRQKVQTFIQSGLVKVNWKVIDQTSFECKQFDILSVRGFGRSRIQAVEGKTKKDKWRIIVGRQQK